MRAEAKLIEAEKRNVDATLKLSTWHEQDKMSSKVTSLQHAKMTLTSELEQLRMRLHEASAQIEDRDRALQEVQNQVSSVLDSVHAGCTCPWSPGMQVADIVYAPDCRHCNPPYGVEERLLLLNKTSAPWVVYTGGLSRQTSTAHKQAPLSCSCRPKASRRQR